MPSKCSHCKSPFEVTDEDRSFLEHVAPVIAEKRYDMPPPTLCPNCRRQRRLAWRNESHLYKRTCDFSKRGILSIFAPDAPYRVYGQEEWWSDKWDALEYGRAFDPSRPFFEQFAELQREVPRMALLQSNNQNSEYTNYVSHLKDCYLLFSADFNEDCHYGIWIEKSKDCTDNLLITECQLSYESVYCQGNYHCVSAVLSSNCSDCAFVFDCKGCKNCLLCSGLRQKEYCILNTQYTKDEYEKKLRELPLHTRTGYAATRVQFLSLLQKAIHPSIWSTGRVEASTGDLLTNVTDCAHCFETINAKDCAHLHGAFDIKDARDGCYAALGELAYEMCECVPTPYHSAFTMNSYTGSNLLYCDCCMNDCQDCFGCVGLKKKRYCILNKQYSKEEYEAIVPTLIEHMRKAGEWGEFFPAQLSFFAYNETNAQEFFPMTKEEVIAGGWRWRDEEETSERGMSPITAPDDIAQVTDDITKQVLGCASCGKGFKVIAQELAFYKTMQLPVPDRCPACRRAARMALRNPAHLWVRPCSACKKEIHSSYAPNRPEDVRCQECYMAVVY